MFRKTVWLASMLVLSCAISSASAQSPAPATKKYSVARLKEMKAKWSQNKSKLAACRKEVKAKGLIEDNRWFYIEQCMDKT